MPRTATAHPAVAYVCYARGTDSWKKVCTEIDKSLGARFSAYRRFAYRDRFDFAATDIVIGQSEHCLEVFLKVRRHNPRAVAIVHQECTVLGDHVAILNRERKRCGLAPIVTAPIDLWRNRLENDLADHFIVASSVARSFYLDNGFEASRVHAIPFGMRCGRFHFRGRTRTTRFLFLGTDPFRKGVRPLLAAWDRAGLRNAELICFTTPEVLQSKLLLKYLVRNPNISLRPLSGQRQFIEQYEHVDCQVLPSLEDAFSLAVADGMGVGKPAIVSAATGIKDVIAHGVNGHVVPAGDVDRLAASLQHFAANRMRLRAMGEAAYETARAYPWERFHRTVGAVVEAIWAEGR
jgi:glycosyltransferase involved in cell wall biosynthesis